MSDAFVARWVEEVLDRCATWNVVFVHLGAAYPVAREALVVGVGEVIDAIDYLAGAESAGNVRLIDNVEKLAREANGLGRLRERVVRDRDAGDARIILLSRRPRVAYPDVPGSSVLRDAKLVAPPRYGIGESDGVGFGAEGISLGTPQDVILRQALRELGEAACAGLDALVFEDWAAVRDPQAFEERLQDGLISAGLLAVTGSALDWVLDEPEEELRNALSDVVAGIRSPQEDFGAVAAHCWSIERLVKQALRARAQVIWGAGWRSELLGSPASATSVERAVRTSYADAVHVDDLRDPLEWLTLGEVLSLRRSASVGSLGLVEAMWTKLAVELLPVKDRVERSQLLRKDDVNVSRRWASLLPERLSTSGSVNPTEVIKASVVTQRDLLTRLRMDLAENPQLIGDVEKDCMSLVVATVRFLAHALDTPLPFTGPFAQPADAPLERALQDSFKVFLDASDLAGRVAAEVSAIGSGRADVVLYLNDGARYVTEVKRDLTRSAREDLEAKYLPQSLAYQSANVPFSQLLVLDLVSTRDVESERLDRSVWLTHRRDDAGLVLSTVLVAVVRGNRQMPSRRKR